MWLDSLAALPVGAHIKRLLIPASCDAASQAVACTVLRSGLTTPRLSALDDREAPGLAGRFV